MRSRTLLLLAILLVMIVGLYSTNFMDFRSISASYIDQALRSEHLSQQSPGSVARGTSPQQALEALHKRYRLQPDRRLLLALTYLQQLTGHTSAGIPKSAFEGGRWHIHLEGKDVGQLSELPTFDELVSLLRKVAKSRLSQTQWAEHHLPSPVPSPSGFSPVALQRHLQSLDVRWHSEGISAKLLTEAATTQIKLAWSSHIAVDENDATSAKALALLALAQEASQRPLHRQESMLAAICGYHTHADLLLPKLDMFDAWRLYREKRDVSLHALASSSSSGQEAVDLWLTRLASENRVADWQEWFTSHYQTEEPPLYPMQTALMMGNSIARNPAVHLLPVTIIAAAHPKAQGGKFITDALFRSDQESNDELFNKAIAATYLQLKQSYDISTDRLSQLLASRDKEMSGPLLTAADFHAYYQRLYQGSLENLGLYYLDQRGTMEESRLFSALLPDDKPSANDEIARWYKNLVDSNHYRANKKALLADLSGTTQLTTSMLLRTLKELTSLYGYAASQRRLAAAHVIAKMDSRIGHRYALIGIAREHLLNFHLSEKLAESIRQQEANNSYNLTAWLGNYYQDSDLLLQVALNKDIPPTTRSNALSDLTNLKPNDTQLELYFETLIREEPEKWGIRKAYIDYLTALKKYDQAIDVTTTWMLLTTKETDPFNIWQATIAISELQLKQGDAQKAWNTLSTVTDSMYGPALALAMRIKIELGELDAAQQWALKAAQRYPNGPKHITNLLEVLWRQGEYRSAAEILQKLLQRFSPDDLRFKLAKQFADVFKGDSQQTAKAIAALQSAGIDSKTLIYFPQGFSDQEDYQRAFEIQSKLHFNGFGQIAFFVKAYNYLEKWQGSEAALDWLKDKIPSRFQNMGGMLYFGEKQYPLLWSMIKNPGTDQYPDAIWLYRAAAYIEGVSLTPAQHSALVNYYNGNNNSKYDRIGRYLMGKGDGTTLLTTPMDSRTLSETAFYLALKAKHEKNYEEMADWFLISVEASNPSNGEYRWSHDQLYSWYTKGHSLSIILSN